MERAGIFKDIYSELKHQRDLHPDGVPVLTVTPLEDRSNRLDNVFNEGEKFSGIARQGNAMACITMPASPHEVASIPKSRFLGSVSEILNKGVLLPEQAQAAELVAPQLIVWWNNLSVADGKCDLVDIYKLPEKEQKDISELVAGNVLKAALIINNLKSFPIIWGSWGFATMEERVRFGRSRGCPTIGLGHCHVVSFDPENQPLELRKDLNPLDIINHFAPWSHVLIKKFGDSIGKVINTIIEDEGLESAVNILDATQKFSNGAMSVEDGYIINFDKKIAFESVFRLITQIAGRLEDWYQTTGNLYSEYYKSYEDPEKHYWTRKNMALSMERAGFDNKSSEEFTDFLLGIKPTYEQILTWESELSKTSAKDDKNLIFLQSLKRRYERISSHFSRKEDHSLQCSLIQDTCKPHNLHGANEFTWPVHASACFAIEDYSVLDGKLFVGSFKLFPVIASTEAVPQIKLGTTLRRKAA